MSRKTNTYSLHCKKSNDRWKHKHNHSNVNCFEESLHGKKTKLRNGLDVYNRLMRDETLNINLHHVYIGYTNREFGDREVCILDWIMRDKEGTIALHHILYFKLQLNNNNTLLLWDRKTQLDRIFCSGITKPHQSLSAMLSAPKRKKQSQNKKQTTLHKFFIKEEEKQKDTNPRKMAKPLKNTHVARYFTIISGGQIGADQGGLEAAKQIGIQTAGWAPIDFYTMNGNYDPSLGTKYGLKAVERTPNMRNTSKGYLKRDRLNVNMCDALIAFIYDEPKTGRGTLTTCNYAMTKICKYHNVDRRVKIQTYNDTSKWWKPVLILVDLSSQNSNHYAIKCKTFIEQTSATKIMIAGSAMTKLQPLVRNVLIKAFKLLN